MNKIEMPFNKITTIFFFTTSLGLFDQISTVANELHLILDF